MLVTGGAGFIGSHLCERLLKTNNKVICLDNLYAGNLNNINHLLIDPSFKFINHDINKPVNLKVDAIYNLASPASPVHYQKNPVFTIKTNIYGAFKCLDLAKLNNCPILQASTSEIYGCPEVHPQKEDYWGNVNPIGIRSCYDEGKRCAETIFFDYYRQHNVDIKVVRIFNTYGPRMDINDGRVICNFIVQALKGEDLTIYGNGEQTRSFQYVEDLIDGVISLMNKPKGFTGPVNIGNPIEFTILDLAKKILELVDSDSGIIYKKLPSDDPMRRKPDISLANKELNKWVPKIELEEGLLKTIDYFKFILKNQ